MSRLNWANLRTWGGSQHTAFEELCCQLAAHEASTPGSQYRRIGTPDAGVECTWTLEDQTVKAWQAKYFLAPPQPNEWSQLDESVKRAISAYPKLREYTVCLPIDRPDARKTGQTSMMSRWDDRVSKWRGWAREKGMDVTFHYWGEHEIIERLSRTHHAGRQYFWFHGHVFGSDWFREKFDIARANAGPRYSPELNVQLDISRVFDALARHPRFIRRLLRQSGALRRELRRAQPVRPSATISGETGSAATSSQVTTEALRSAADLVRVKAEELAKASLELESRLQKIDIRASEHLDLGSAVAACDKIGEALDALDSAFHTFNEATTAAKSESLAAKSGSSLKPEEIASGTGSHSHETERYHLWQAHRRLRTLMSSLSGAGAAVSNKPALLVRGVAGTGKTHLFCDVADRGLQEDMPCVLLLGEQFDRGDPWQQIIQQLHLDCTPDELLGALSAAGESSNHRTVILIDALNEGEGRIIWPKLLPGLLAKIRSYPWLAVGLSVRSSYETLVIPDDAKGHLVVVDHDGFAEQEIEATRRFFDAFGIERPTVPLLTPEFSNPLFLKLFCQGIRNRGLHRIPDGLDGITAVFDFFLESVEERLSQPARLDFDRREGVVGKALKAVAQEMVRNGTQWVTRSRATEIVNSFLPYRPNFQQTLLHGLLTEGVLSEEMIWLDSPSKGEEVIRFTYERLADHQIAALLLREAQALIDDGRPDPTSAPSSLSDIDKDSESQDQPARPLVQPDAWPPALTLTSIEGNEMASWHYRGIVAALAIQVPERYGRELWELFPGLAEHRVLEDAFLESLNWRRPNAIGSKAIKIVERYIVERDQLGDNVRDLLLQLAIRPNHPLNAQFLDKSLRSQTMADRDVWWSTYCASQEGIGTPLGRLIDWAWRAGGEKIYSDESITLCATALLWTLTTSQRSIRDQATKALVSILHSRSGVLRSLVRQFDDVDDPYVTERLYAVAYGCALRGLSRQDLQGLAGEVFAAVFERASPRPHLLLRDYARGIIELAAIRGELHGLDVSLARPPYKSDPPGPAPTEAELRAQYYTPFELGKDEGYFSLWFSLLSQGDFARYVVGTNSHSFDWSSRPLDGLNPPTKRSRHDAFANRLPSTLRSAWYEIASERALLSLRLGDTLELQSGEAVVVSEELIEALRTTRIQYFRRRLPESLRNEFDEVKDWGGEPVQPYQFDLEYTLRWLFKRVVELGWSPDRFASFDRHRPHESRMSHRAERVGKKYQWIAYHEFLARVADNFEFVGDAWSQKKQVYHGPWQMYRRDIDPSYLGYRQPDRWSERHGWWQPVRYEDWHRIRDDKDWIASVKDLPNLQSVITPREPINGTPWLWLTGIVNWTEPEPPDEEPYEKPRRSIRYWITSYLVRAKDINQITDDLFGHDLWSGELHEAAQPTEVFLGEFTWAPAYRTQNESPIAKPWRRLGQKSKVPVIPTAESFYWEARGYDMSIEGSVNLATPAPALIGANPGKWRRPRSRADFFNPSINGTGPDALLAREESLARWLEERELRLFWVMTGEKILIGGGFGNRDDWEGRLEFSEVVVFDRGRWPSERVVYLTSGPEQRKRL
jgi:hypothetical protein